MATLVLGLGNPILSDDGVGIHVVRALAESWSSRDVTLAEASVGGLRLLDILAGYDRVILVDAIQTPEGRVGDIYCLQPNDLHQSMHAGCTHDLSLSAALDLGRGLGMDLPADKAVVILAIEVQDVLSFGEECTPQVAGAIPRVVEMLHTQILDCGPSACRRALHAKAPGPGALDAFCQARSSKCSFRKVWT